MLMRQGSIELADDSDRDGGQLAFALHGYQAPRWLDRQDVRAAIARTTYLPHALVAIHREQIRDVDLELRAGHRIRRRQTRLVVQLAPLALERGLSPASSNRTPRPQSRGGKRDQDRPHNRR
jgi:hypothetical protein